MNSQDKITESSTLRTKKKRTKFLRNKKIASFKANFLNNIPKIIIFLIGLFFVFQLIFNEIFKVKTKTNYKSISKENKENNTVNKTDNNNISQSNNISRNITEEIEQFIKTLKKVDDNEILTFRKNNSDNILYDKTKYKRSENPDISVILTMSNQAHCIHKALRSIQNQSLKNIEIIISLDCSLDNSTETILSYMKEDERIILIDHDANEGTMKNRVDGFRKAKGKYITALDGDDAFIQKDILKNALHIANIGDIDIVEFYGNMYKNGKYRGSVHYHRANGIIKQPELRTHFFSVKENDDRWRPIDCRVIWGKLIKNELLKKAIEIIGPKYTDDYMMWYEDTTIGITLYQIGQSYYLFKEAGYYYSRDDFYGRYPKLPYKTCKKKGIFSISMDAVKFVNYLYEKMEDNEIERKTLCHEIISVHAYDFSKFTNINDHFDMVYRVIDGIINSKYLTENEKEKLRTIKNDVVNKENNKKRN
jgi:glycosyltransferase involved in cell wall biosynthesis